MRTTAAAHIPVGRNEPLIEQARQAFQLLFDQRNLPASAGFPAVISQCSCGCCDTKGM